MIFLALLCQKCNITPFNELRNLLYFTNVSCFVLFVIFRFVCHLIEEVYKFGESRLEPNLNSNMNIQASHNEGVTQTLGEVRATLAEVTVIQSEERDGRLNERLIFCSSSVLPQF